MGSNNIHIDVFKDTPRDDMTRRAINNSHVGSLDTHKIITMHVPSNESTNAYPTAQSALDPSRLAHNIAIRSGYTSGKITTLLKASNGNMLLSEVGEEDRPLVLAREGLNIVLKHKKLVEYDRITVTKQEMSINSARDQARVKTPLHCITTIILSQQGLGDSRVS